MKTKIIIFFSICLFSACSKLVQNITNSNTTGTKLVMNNWKKFEVLGNNNKFSFYITPDFTEVPVQGEDSIVKRYENTKSFISLDYGVYSEPLDSYKNMAEYEESNASKAAKIISYKNEGKYISAITFPQINNSLKLTVYIESSEKEIKNTVKKIFESINFNA